MPEIFVYTSEDDGKRLSLHLRELGGLSLALRQATVEALWGYNPQDVRVRLFTQVASSGATRVLVHGISELRPEFSPDVQKIGQRWAREISLAWDEYLPKFGRELSVRFPLTEVEIWITMQEGLLLSATKAHLSWNSR